MDDTTLRTLLDRALTDEPPIGPVADNALRAGIKVRRRRVLGAVAAGSVVAAIAVAIPALTGPPSAPPPGQDQASTWRVHNPASLPPPAESVLRWGALAKDRASVVKITGTATNCGVRLEGSGFVVSPDHVLTNAHVVAGVDAGLSVLAGHSTRPATVVLFDPRVDTAMLYVPGLTARPLRFTGPAPLGSDAVVAGYPLNGRFRAIPARVGSQRSAALPNIYRTGTVSRAIYEVRAALEPGSLGAPLLAKDGKVYGVISARSANDPGFGFALTAGAVQADVRAGAHATTVVSTRRCVG